MILQQTDFHAHPACFLLLEWRQAGQTPFACSYCHNGSERGNLIELLLHVHSDHIFDPAIDCIDSHRITDHGSGLSLFLAIRGGRHILCLAERYQLANSIPHQPPI